MTQSTLSFFPVGNARIININSTAARVRIPKISLYTPSKAAIKAFTKSWAAELVGRGVTVNTVASGSTRSDLLIASTTTADLDREALGTPVKRRLGVPNDVAQVVAWLASEESRWISGQCICAGGVIACIDLQGSLALIRSDELSRSIYVVCETISKICHQKGDICKCRTCRGLVCNQQSPGMGASQLEICPEYWKIQGHKQHKHS